MLMCPDSEPISDVVYVPPDEAGFVLPTTTGNFTIDNLDRSQVPQEPYTPLLHEEPQGQVCPTCGRCPTCGYTPSPYPYLPNYWYPNTWHYRITC